MMRSPQGVAKWERWELIIMSGEMHGRVLGDRSGATCAGGAQA